MNLNTVLQKSWKMLWNYRALWLFGAVLALVGANSIYTGPWPNREENQQWTRIKITDSATIQVPWGDMTVDLTDPEGVLIITPGSTTWREFRQMVDELNRDEAINLWPILIELGVILVVTLLLGMTARYVVETAVIRMVNDTEESGRHLSVREGLQRGWSVRAGRLFLLDLVVGVLALLLFIVLFGLAITPVLLSIGSHEAILITVGVGTVGLLILAGYLWLAASAALSLVLQPIRRACVLEDQGLLAAMRKGVLLVKHNLKDAGLVWLIWMGIRLLWIPIGGMILIVLAPILLVTILSGIAVAGVPTALIAEVAGLYTSSVTAWIMGALVGLPIFILVMISPLLFFNGLVEIYKSCIWTLAYRDLSATEQSVPAPAPQIPLTPISNPAN